MINAGITIRKYKMSDIDRLCEIFINERVISLLGIPKKIKDLSRADERKWIKETIKNYGLKKPKNLTFAITANDKYVGGIGIHHIDYDNEKAEVGFWVGEPYWGKGYATKALKQFIKYIFKRFQFKRLQGVAYSHNIASQKVMLNAGFKFEGEMKKNVKRLGKFYNDRIYAIVK